MLELQKVVMLLLEILRSFFITIFKKGILPNIASSTQYAMFGKMQEFLYFYGSF